MRFNVKFTIEKNGQVENKFEVLETDSKYDKINAKVMLCKKYPEHEITVLKITQATSAQVGI